MNSTIFLLPFSDESNGSLFSSFQLIASEKIQIEWFSLYSFRILNQQSNSLFQCAAYSSQNSKTGFYKYILRGIEPDLLSYGFQKIETSNGVVIALTDSKIIEYDYKYNSYKIESGNWNKVKHSILQTPNSRDEFASDFFCFSKDILSSDFLQVYKQIIPDCQPNDSIQSVLTKTLIFVVNFLKQNGFVIQSIDSFSEIEYAVKAFQKNCSLQSGKCDIFTIYKMMSLKFSNNSNDLTFQKFEDCFSQSFFQKQNNVKTSYLKVVPGISNQCERKTVF